MLESKEIVVGGYKDRDGSFKDITYIVTKFPATKGIDIQLRLAKGLDAELLKDVICPSVALGSVSFNTKMFDEHFSGRYSHLMNVFDAVIEFNFDENFTESASTEM